MPTPNNNLRAILDEKQATQTQLAETMGISQATVNRWVTGARDIAAGQAAKICEVLEISLSDLLLGHIPSAANEPPTETE